MSIDKWLKKHTGSLVGKTVAVSGATGGLGRALSELGDRALPDGEVRRALSELAQRIESPTLREAVFACEEAEGVLAAAFVKRKSELPARVKAGRALIVFFGLTVLLLLG